jgi:tetratricopeptide (TPR) repeat protein
MKKKVTAAVASTPSAAPEQALAQAWQAFSEGRFTEADKLCADVVKKVPAHGHGWHLRALSALALNKPKQALQHLAHIKDAPELLPGLAQARGRAFLALGRSEEALGSFQETLGYKADDAATHHLLALALLAQGDVTAARQYFRRATLLDPALGSAHYELGVLALAAGEARQAVAAFSAAAQHLPGVAQVHNNLALALQAEGDATGAEQSLRRALELDDRYAEAWFNLAGLLHAAGNAEASEEARATALRLNPALAQVRPA